MTELDQLRQEIDRLDADIVKLLSERFEVVRRIGDVKKREGLPVLNAAREQIVLEKVAGMVKNEEEKLALQRVYKEIMAAAKDLEKK